MKKAFLFDLEGVLLNTYPCYVKSIIYVFLALKRKYSIEVTVPVFAEISKIIEDKPYKECRRLLMAQFPQFLPYTDEFSALFEQCLLDELTHSEVLLIKDNLQVFANLINLNYKVAVVTNCPEKLTLFLLEIIKKNYNFGFGQGNFYAITPELCQGLTKPNPALYLTAAQKLVVDPENCVVVEDSYRGVQAASAAGMMIIGLQNSLLEPTALTDIANFEMVKSIKESKLIPPKCLQGEQYKTSYTLSDRIDILGMADVDRELLVKETFKVYRTLFAGRDYNSWRELFFNEKLAEAMIVVVKDVHSKICGFHLVTGYFVDYENHKRLIIKLFMGVLPECRKSGVIGRSYFKVTRYIYNKYKQYPIDIFENITGPVAYANACNFFGKYLLTRKNYHYSDAEVEYIKFLNEYFDYRVVGNQPFLIRSTSMVFVEQEVMKAISETKNKNIIYFIDQTKLQPGVGLACLVRANPGFLNQITWMIIRIVVKKWFKKVFRKLFG